MNLNKGKETIKNKMTEGKDSVDKMINAATSPVKKYYSIGKSYVLTVWKGIRRFQYKFVNEYLPSWAAMSEDLWHGVQRIAGNTKEFSKTVKGKVVLSGAATCMAVFIGMFVFLAETAPYAVYEDGSVVENPWSVTVNGEEVAVVSSERAGNKVIKGIKEEYLYDGSDVEKCNIEPQIEIEKKDLKRGENPPVVTKVDDAVTYIVNGTKEPVVYEVKSGDTVSEIADEQDVSVNELAAMNDHLDVDDIREGDKLNMYKVDPIVDVESTEVVTVTENISRKTTYVNDSSMYEGEERVKESGSDGSREVTKRVKKLNGEVVESEVLETKVLKEATNRVVYKGTKTRSYYSGGSSKSYHSASYYTSYNSSKGSAVVAYAKQFLGTPYVWGGSSLTGGTDCSGFVMSVYRHFGVSLPHSSTADRGVGVPVSVSNIKPGDIVCYSGHVAMYVGGGRIIHASTPRTGVCYGNLHYKPIICVRRIFN